MKSLLGALAVVGFLTAATAAADLDEVLARGELIWAADQEGGGPHVFPDPADPQKLTGFEVDLAALLAEELGVKPRFQQGQWDRLPLLLGRTADCVINGIELTPAKGPNPAKRRISGIRSSALIAIKCTPWASSR